MLRYSLGSLFLALLYLSIGCAALVNATGIWLQVAVTLSVVILVLFSLGAIFWEERRRAFAIGFAVTGWLYFMLVFSGMTNVRPYLLTQAATDWLYATVHGDQNTQASVVWQPVRNAPGTRANGVVYTATVPSPQPGNTPSAAYSFSAVPRTTSGQPVVDSHSFANIGHSLWAVIAGFAGGAMALVFWTRTRRRQGDGARDANYQ